MSTGLSFNIKPDGSRLPAWMGYIIAPVLEVALVLLLHFLSRVTTLEQYPFSYLVLTVTIAYFFGAGPAALAFIVSLAAFMFVPTASGHSVWPTAHIARSWTSIVVFVLGSVLTSAAVVINRTYMVRIENLAGELQKSNDETTGILESISDAFVAVDRNWTFLYVNSAAERAFKTKRDEVIGTNFWDYVLSDEKPQLYEMLNRVMRERVPETAEFWAVRLESWVEIHAYPCPDGITMYVQDIGVRKRYEAALESEKNRLRAVLSALPVGVLISDAKGRLVEANDAMRNVAGGRAPLPQTIEEYSVYKGWWPDTGEPVLPEEWPLSRALTTGVPVVGEVIDVEKFNGEHGTMMLSASPFKDSEGNVMGGVVVCQDITEIIGLRRELEQALERETYFSRTLQRALLPEKPVIGKGYAIADIYIPAFASREIGGDFYDVFNTRDGRIGVLIGDVSGKGLESASAAATTRSTARAFAFEYSSTCQALAHTNLVLYTERRGQDMSATFITALLIIIEPLTGNFCYATAGHPPAVVRRSDGRVETLEVGNLPIGVVSEQEFVERWNTLAPGDKIVLYTDGLSEARRGPEFFGIEGIQRVLEEKGAQSASEILDALVAAARDWASGRLADDTALIVIEPGPFHVEEC
jgi:PAS domain S-box-containing protein